MSPEVAELISEYDDLLPLTPGQIAELEQYFANGDGMLAQFQIAFWAKNRNVERVK